MCSSNCSAGVTMMELTIASSPPSFDKHSPPSNQAVRSRIMHGAASLAKGGFSSESGGLGLLNRPGAMEPPASRAPP